MPGNEGLGILMIFEKSSELRSDAGQSELIFDPGRGQYSGATGWAAHLLGQMEWSA